MTDLSEVIVSVRDIKDNRVAPVLAFTQLEWSGFLPGVKAEEFDEGVKEHHYPDDRIGMRSG